MIERIEIGLTIGNNEAPFRLLNQRLNEGWQIINQGTYSYDGETAEFYTLYKPDEPTPDPAPMGEVTLNEKEIDFLADNLAYRWGWEIGVLMSKNNPSNWGLLGLFRSDLVYAPLRAEYDTPANLAAVTARRKELGLKD